MRNATQSPHTHHSLRLLRGVLLPLLAPHSSWRKSSYATVHQRTPRTPGRAACSISSALQLPHAPRRCRHALWPTPTPAERGRQPTGRLCLRKVLLQRVLRRRLPTRLPRAIARSCSELPQTHGWRWTARETSTTASFKKSLRQDCRIAELSRGCYHIRHRLRSVHSLPVPRHMAPEVQA